MGALPLINVKVGSKAVRKAAASSGGAAAGKWGAAAATAADLGTIERDTIYNRKAPKCLSVIAIAVNPLL